MGRPPTLNFRNFFLPLRGQDPFWFLGFGFWVELEVGRNFWETSASSHEVLGRRGIVSTADSERQKFFLQLRCHDPFWFLVFGSRSRSKSEEIFRRGALRVMRSRGLGSTADSERRKFFLPLRGRDPFWFLVFGLTSSSKSEENFWERERFAS